MTSSEIGMLARHRGAHRQEAGRLRGDSPGARQVAPCHLCMPESAKAGMTGLDLAF